MSTTRSISPKAPATDAGAETALLLCGHGRAGGPGVLSRHAERLADAGFAEVRVACLRGKPSLAEAVASIDAPHIRLVPVLMADGYLARVTLARAMDGLGADAARLSLAPVLGRNARLAEVLLAYALRAARVRHWLPREATLLVVGHGTPRDAGSRTAAMAHAGAIRRRGLFGRVAAAFLEDRPSLAQAAGAGSAPVVAAGLFVEAGPHGDGDVRDALAALRRPTAYTGAIGGAPEIPGLLLEQAALAARHPVAA
jgi:sirohydrochlorin cobaltochelatase